MASASEQVTSRSEHVAGASDEQIRAAATGKNRAEIEKELQMFEKLLDVIRPRGKLSGSCFYT
jgi:hypothetical protein